MKSFLILLTVMALCSFGWAQGDGNGPLCTDAVNGPDDNTCNSFTSDCDVSDHGCSVSVFTASCTGDYDIDAWLTTTGTNVDCKVCVRVKKHNTTTVMGQCVLDYCAEGAMRKTCSAAAELIVGEEYDIVVCLTYCEDWTSCVNHCAAATAHGCVRYAQTSPCW